MHGSDRPLASFVGHGAIYQLKVVFWFQATKYNSNEQTEEFIGHI